MGLTVTGAESVTVRLDKLVAPDKLRPIMGQAGALVERAAKQKAPKDIGTLARSIEYEVDASGLSCTVFTPLEYAPYVEYGTGIYAEHGGRTDVPWRYQDDKSEWHTTSGQHPQPFMRPAIKENKRQIVQTIKRGLLDV